MKPFRRAIQIFPYFICRLGRNFPWKGRQTLCKQYENKNLQSETLIKIYKAKSPIELRLLFNQLVDGFQRHRPLPFNFQPNWRHQKPSAAAAACTIGRRIKAQKSGKAALATISNRSLIAIGQHKRTAQISETLKSACSSHRYSLKKTFRRNSDSVQESSQYLHPRADVNASDWCIQLASHCYETDIQWHVNHLAECFERTKSESKQTVNASAKADDIRSNSVEYRRLLKRYLDRDADDENICNIRIDINGIINSQLSRPSESFDACQSAEASATIWPEYSNRPCHASDMNASIDAINQNNPFALHQQRARPEQYGRQSNASAVANETNHIDDIIQTLCALNFDSSEYQQRCHQSLPQIVLTDCSTDSAASAAVANSFAAAGAAYIANNNSNNNPVAIAVKSTLGSDAAAVDIATIAGSSTSNIIGKSHHSSSSLPLEHQKFYGCLTIPDEIYYRNESRPP